MDTTMIVCRFYLGCSLPNNHADWKHLLILYFNKFRRGGGGFSPNTKQIEGKQDLIVLELIADALKMH